ncbi:hypothetical protein PIROE2DRAFT_1554 [Piromyces sp. E2]|nr:hypothetical protein PIROE2DRAFT_1554 [Piromyces sp. E2]|eukprot:OUM70394.1 hypothetical protein PIROE2DRAFT_1554 [Piromyces sp. E2]
MEFAKIVLQAVIDVINNYPSSIIVGYINSLIDLIFDILILIIVIGNAIDIRSYMESYGSK